MSDLTRCNYCNLKSIKRRAKSKGLVVTKRSGDFGLGGMDVFVHPKEIKICVGDKVQRDKYFVSWLMEIPKYCCC